jgi:hypothetical protein
VPEDALDITMKVLLVIPAVTRPMSAHIYEPPCQIWERILKWSVLGKVNRGGLTLTLKMTASGLWHYLITGGALATVVVRSVLNFKFSLRHGSRIVPGVPTLFGCGVS